MLVYEPSIGPHLVLKPSWCVPDHLSICFGGVPESHCWFPCALPVSRFGSGATISHTRIKNHQTTVESLH